MALQKEINKLQTEIDTNNIIESTSTNDKLKKELNNKKKELNNKKRS